MTEILKSMIAAIGIDIGKNWFHVVGLDGRGAIALRQKWSRGQVEARLANMPACLIGMEACVGAHHLSRRLSLLGHDARLMPAKYVRAYSKGQKNDFRDAEAIAEAVQRPTMKFVATKTADQLDLQALHRVRERLVSQRTGIINQIRAFLLERGVAVRQGLRVLRAELLGVLATRCDVLAPRMVRIIADLAGDWRRHDQRIEALAGEIEALGRRDGGCERPLSVPHRRRYDYFQDAAPVPELVAVNVKNRTHRIEARVTVPDGGAEGVLRRARLGWQMLEPIGRAIAITRHPASVRR